MFILSSHFALCLTSGWLDRVTHPYTKRLFLLEVWKRHWITACTCCWQCLVALAGQAVAATFQGNFSLLSVASLFQLSWALLSAVQFLSLQIHCWVGTLALGKTVFKWDPRGKCWDNSLFLCFLGSRVSLQADPVALVFLCAGTMLWAVYIWFLSLPDVDQFLFIFSPVDAWAVNVLWY